jgi:polyferredoxin
VTAPTRADLSASLIDLVRKDARRKSRRAALGKFLGVLVLVVLYALANGFYLMIAVELIHEHWMPQVPGLGYWWAVLIAFTLRAALAPNTSSKKSEAVR